MPVDYNLIIVGLTIFFALVVVFLFYKMSQLMIENAIIENRNFSKSSLNNQSTPISSQQAPVSSKPKLPPSQVILIDTLYEKIQSTINIELKKAIDPLTAGELSI